MILLALIALQPLEVPTLQEVLQLPPAAAGDRVLQGKSHRRIASLHNMNDITRPPGIEELKLVEEAVVSEGGCSRKRWTAIFRHRENSDLALATLTSSYSTTEIKLAASATCGSDNYVHLNPGVDLETGFTALAKLDDMRAGLGNHQYACTDETGSGLCKDAASIRRELAALSPWFVTRKDKYLELVLGTTPGQVVTAVRFKLERPDAVEVTRRIPPPF